MLPYISTFNLSFFWMITYWLVIFFLDEIAHLVAVMLGKENAYIQRLNIYQSRIHLCWLISLVFAFVYSVKGAITFLVCALPLMGVFYLIHLGFARLRFKASKRYYRKQVRKNGFVEIH